MSNSRLMTFLSCRFAIFCFNVASRRVAPSRSSSKRSSSSLSISWLSSPSRGISVRNDDAPVSTGITASVPYVNRNGVSPVVECGVVRCCSVGPEHVV
ncbi:hypothetical protein L195_g039379 [Trifolium pratense]|uniref:Secreted protein n=1 Tax=Trifolium pratense TaxID=57577 RepID=A0A2K3LXS8_TRIPR|nr:hypothetical protein L195_g039379 [Trifolium pratense]